MPPAKQEPAERLPSWGAKAALLTKKGIITGMLTSWSDTGAIVEANGEGLAGSEVRLRVQGPDRIWEKRATVLWVHKDHGIGLEFELDDTSEEGLMRRVLDSLTAEKRRTPTPSPVEKELANTSVGKTETSTDRRSHRRIRIAATAEVTRTDRGSSGPDITTISDASSSGVVFTTNRSYSIGTKLLVKYPYPSSSLPRQAGNVVRVERLPYGLWRVAVQFSPDRQARCDNQRWCG
jgi:hypothetical protein